MEQPQQEETNYNSTQITMSMLQPQATSTAEYFPEPAREKKVKGDHVVAEEKKGSKVIVDVKLNKDQLMAAAPSKNSLPQEEEKVPLGQDNRSQD